MRASWSRVFLAVAMVGGLAGACGGSDTNGGASAPVTSQVPSSTASVVS